MKTSFSTVAGENRYYGGRSLALTAAALLLCDAVLVVGLGGFVLAKLWAGGSLRELMDRDGLPVGIYLTWALGVFGSVLAIIAIALHRFRDRWFWRCLLVAAAAWLVFPPIHAVIGLLALILLVRFQAAFPARSLAGG